MELLELTRRKTAVAWLALGLGAGSFFLLLPARGLSLSLQYAAGMAILAFLGFRWWTNPAHPGIVNYLSPHTIILLHSFVYFGPGSLPRMAFPEEQLIGYHNIGADDYYLPMLLLALAGLLIFDLLYRMMARKLHLNAALESGYSQFHSSRIQAFLPVCALFWYALCLGGFLYMTGNYIMRPFMFEGVEGAFDNIFLQGGYWLIGTAWIIMSLLLFKPGPRAFQVAILLLLVLLLPVLFAYQNRRIIVYCLAVTVLVYFLYPQRVVRLKAVIWSMILILGAFVLMTSVRYISTTDPSLKRYAQEDKNIFRRTARIISSPGFMSLEPVNAVIRSSIYTRLNGLDWAAAMMEGRANNQKPFLWGSHNFPAAATIIPRVIWPGKPTPAIEGEINRHFELAYFDQLGSLVGSAYADGGPLGVLLGFGFLGLVFPPAVWLVFQRKDGMIVYLGAVLPLLAYENFVLKYPLEWLRWVLILMAFNSILYWFFLLVRARRETMETQ